MNDSEPSTPPKLNLAVQYAVATRGLPSRTQFRRWARAALRRDARVTVRVVGDAEGEALNRTYRNRNYATNVLTFVFREKPPYEGDLALCAPVVAREARAQGKTAVAHYAHLTVHGLLHLQGYDHENEADAFVMEGLEKRIMAKLGYADPYLEERKAKARK
jgi:probable rRNA maturation factor